MCVMQALAEQQKAQLAQQQQPGAPQTQAAPTQSPAAGQPQVPQTVTVTGAAAVPNAAVLVGIEAFLTSVLLMIWPVLTRVSYFSDRSHKKCHCGNNHPGWYVETSFTLQKFC